MHQASPTKAELLEALSLAGSGHPDLSHEVAVQLGDDASDHLTTSIAGIIHYIDLHHSDWTLTRLGPGQYAATIHARRMSFGATPALALCGAALRAMPQGAPQPQGRPRRAPVASDSLPGPEAL